MVDSDKRVPERRLYGERSRVHFAHETIAERQLIDLPDGRKLAIKSFGNPTDPVVVLFTGSPGSRLGPVPLDEALRAIGVRLLTFDRPGYGDSDKKTSYTAATIADDIKYVLEKLDIQ